MNAEKLIEIEQKKLDGFRSAMKIVEAFLGVRGLLMDIVQKATPPTIQAQAEQAGPTLVASAPAQSEPVVARQGTTSPARKIEATPEDIPEKLRMALSITPDDKLINLRDLVTAALKEGKVVGTELWMLLVQKMEVEPTILSWKADEIFFRYCPKDLLLRFLIDAGVGVKIVNHVKASSRWDKAMIRCLSIVIDGCLAVPDGPGIGVLLKSAQGAVDHMLDHGLPPNSDLALKAAGAVIENPTPTPKRQRRVEGKVPPEAKPTEPGQANGELIVRGDMRSALLQAGLEATSPEADPPVEAPPPVPVNGIPPGDVELAPSNGTAIN